MQPIVTQLNDMSGNEIDSLDNSIISNDDFSVQPGFDIEEISVASEIQQLDELDISMVDDDDSEYIENIQNSACDNIFDETLEDSVQFGQIENIDIGSFQKIHKHLECSVNDAMSMIYAYSTRHNLSWLAIQDLVRLINAIVGNNNLIPSKYLFKKMFEKKDKTKPDIHFYCQSCNKYLGTKKSLEKKHVCENCDKEICKDMKYSKNHFISIPMKYHLENVLHRNREFLEINKHCDTSDATIRDVHDAEHFQRIKSEMGGTSYITLTIYTDGAAVFKSTKDKSFWPIYVLVNEIDLEHRFKRHNIVEIRNT